MSRTLDIDVENNVFVLDQPSLQDSTVGSVIVAEDLGMLQKLAVGDSRLEFFAGNEIVLLPVDLGSRGSRVV